MFRILGFLLGSAVSIGTILLIIGLPELNLPGSLVDDADVESVSRVVETAKADLDALAIEVLGEVSEMIDELPAPPAHEEHATTDNREESPLPLAETTPGEADSVDARVVPEPTGQHEAAASDEASEVDLKWYAFWNPFRSKLAADGFVGQLEKVTGLDYRVVKVKPGVYEVTFAYASDDERRTKLAQIASATGLNLPGS
jgi:hypothetical protein